MQADLLDQEICLKAKLLGSGVPGAFIVLIKARNLVSSDYHKVVLVTWQPFSLVLFIKRQFTLYRLRKKSQQIETSIRARLQPGRKALN
jgi:hypothetical protein